MDARVDFEQVVTRVVVRVLRKDGGAEGGLWPVLPEAGEIACGDGVALEAKVVQAGARRCVVQEGLGGVDEVEAGAVTDFANGDVAGAAGEAFVQAVAVNVGVFGFGKAVAAVIDVVVALAARVARVIQVEAGVVEQHGQAMSWRMCCAW